MVAVVIYRQSNDHWVSRFLHPDIRHCFLCVASRGQWIIIDYTLDGLMVDIVQALPKGVYYQEVSIDKLNLLPVFPTCVGMVKHILGIKNPFILTPWQLLKRIEHGRQS